ncbi:hypothetical protein KC19_10G121700 [Ceratodon purpureus]|uniref:Uncharacterized protein n=1 Tax=Ceratodon purpureus TaxID=3225 RepID=A0A8T0GMA9_CERPU|nr:hypothetical protein KC19_10G121700 [Ceratodon purpureus]
MKPALQSHRPKTPSPIHSFSALSRNQNLSWGRSYSKDHKQRRLTLSSRQLVFESDHHQQVWDARFGISPGENRHRIRRSITLRKKQICVRLGSVGRSGGGSELVGACALEIRLETCDNNKSGNSIAGTPGRFYGI